VFLIYVFVKERRAILNNLLVIPSMYIASWIGWFNSDLGYDRNASTNPLLSLIKYHQKIIDFHSALDIAHPYEASPWSWFYLGLPTSFFYESPNCGTGECSREVLALGTPLIWWFGIIALLLTINYVIIRRDWEVGFIIAGFAANYLPWFLIPDRTTFYFYANALQPFLILSICYTIYVFLKTESGQKYGELTVQSGLALTTLVFIYFLPVYLGTTLSYDAWSARMCFASWI